MTTATRHVGFCPICEGDFKLWDGTNLVHHGYKRPGVGYIIGDCLSVHRMPYELSCDVCHEYKALLINKLEDNTAYLGELNRGEVPCFRVQRRKLNGGYREFEAVDVATPNGYEFTRELERAIRDTEYQIREINREIARMDKWIAAWELKPVRTFEEELEKKAAATAVRLAERDAKRAAKKAKEDALKAKYAKWEQEKADLMLKFTIRFSELADQLNVAATNNEMGLVRQIEYKAIELANEMKKATKKGYLHFYARELNIDETMIALGLAERTERGWVSHKF